MKVSNIKTAVLPLHKLKRVKMNTFQKMSNSIYKQQKINRKSNTKFKLLSINFDIHDSITINDKNAYSDHINI